MPESFYRSSAPEVLAAWEELQEQFRAYHAHARTIREDYPNHDLIESTWGGCLTRLRGLRGEESPGPLWTRKRGEDTWTPSLKTRAGKKLKEHLESVALRPRQVPGMPFEVMNGAKLYHHGFANYSGVAWVTWGCPASEVEADPAFSPALWERVPASAYHLAKEAHEAAREPGKAVAA